MTTEALEENTADLAKGPLLASAELTGLFGRYDYEIAVPLDASGMPGRLVLLYGDNGSGKTTLLKLLWNVLSPAENQGHRTNVARIPFQQLSLVFSDGTSIEARKQDQLIGTFTIELRRPGKELVSAIYEADESGKVSAYSMSAWELETYYNRPARRQVFAAGFPSDSTERAHLANLEAKHAYASFLEELQINPLFLADDRSLYTDDPAIARARERSELQREVEEAGRRAAPGSLVERELSLTISRVNEVLRSLTLTGQSAGSSTAHSIYGDVLRGLAHTDSVRDGSKEPSPEQAAESMIENLLAIGRESPKFEEFELVPHFDAITFLTLLKAVPPGRQAIAQNVLTPYLESVRARMDALGSAERVIRSLMSLLNRFLVDKQFAFSPHDGLRIVTSDGERLAPSALSSGERQLVMLLCTTLLARHNSRLFIIDEPELSLGIPWQREVLGALMSLTEGTTLQFIVATHSAEMVSSERPSLVRLRRQSDAGH